MFSVKLKVNRWCCLRDLKLQLLPTHVVRPLQSKCLDLLKQTLIRATATF